MACDFLQSQGHQILDRNWRSGHLELDIISEAPDGVHFVEVKARTAPVTTSVSDQVNKVKQKRISAAAGQYLNKKQMEGKEVFFDIVSVLFDGEEAVVRDGNLFSYYGNGVLQQTATGSNVNYANSINVRCPRITSGTFKVHCIRLYSRALTADEIAANYAIDKARFNLP